MPLGYESRPDSPAQVGAFLKAEVELWSRVIKEAGIVPQDLRGIGLTAHAQAGPAGGKLTIYADSHSHVLSLEHFRTFAGML